MHSVKLISKLKHTFHVHSYVSLLLTFVHYFLLLSSLWPFLDLSTCVSLTVFITPSYTSFFIILFLRFCLCLCDFWYFLLFSFLLRSCHTQPQYHQFRKASTTWAIGFDVPYSHITISAINNLSLIFLSIYFIMFPLPVPQQPIQHTRSVLFHSSIVALFHTDIDIWHYSIENRSCSHTRCLPESCKFWTQTI